MAGPPAILIGHCSFHRPIRLAQVITSREALASATDDHGGHVLVAVSSTKRIKERTPQIVIESVSFVRTVQRESPDLGRWVINE